MNDSPRIFASLGHPYYVFAPPYLQTSGGVRAMHYLCHALNLLGCEAYVNTTVVHRDLRTPFGGVKESGVGREGGWDAYRFFTEPKNVCINV